MSENGKKIILYSSENGSSAESAILQAFLADESSDIFIHRHIKNFSESISGLAIEEPLLIISIKSKEEMHAFLGLTYLLDRFNLVVKLPPEDQPLAIMASRLRPRLVLYDWSDYDRTRLLLKGFLNKNNLYVGLHQDVSVQCGEKQ